MNLISLDVSKNEINKIVYPLENISLEFLDISFNYVTSFDFSNLSFLETFIAEYNQLESLKNLDKN